jgi:hypothetical protein
MTQKDKTTYSGYSPGLAPYLAERFVCGDAEYRSSRNFLAFLSFLLSFVPDVQKRPESSAARARVCERECVFEESNKTEKPTQVGEVAGRGKFWRYRPSKEKGEELSSGGGS